MISYRSILLPLLQGTLDRSSLWLAFMVAKKFESHVEVFHVRPDARAMIPYVGEGMSGALVDEVMTAAEKDAGVRATESRRMFDEYLAEYDIPFTDEPSEGISAEWREVVGREDEMVALEGRLADLICVRRPFGDVPVEAAAIFEAALFESNQALLVTPPKEVESFGKRIMIAWNGSLEAAHAVTLAMPAILRAESVRAMSVEGWAEGPGSLEALVRRLAWRGVVAETSPAHKAGSGSIGETVLKEAADWGADTIVMGAYTQSRIRQMILGGTTRHVLTHSPLPLLMAH